MLLFVPPTVNPSTGQLQGNCTGWLHFPLMQSIPTSPINSVLHAVSGPATYIFYLFPTNEKIKSKQIFCITLHKLFVFKWIQFFVCKAVEATIFHPSQWNPGDNQYDMPNNRTQWFEFNTLGSRITNVPVAENRSPPHRSGSNCNAQSSEEWKYIKHMQS